MTNRSSINFKFYIIFLYNFILILYNFINFLISNIDSNIYFKIINSNTYKNGYSFLSFDISYNCFVSVV